MLVETNLILIRFVPGFGSEQKRRSVTATLEETDRVSFFFTADLFNLFLPSNAARFKMEEHTITRE